MRGLGLNSLARPNRLTNLCVTIDAATMVIFPLYKDTARQKAGYSCCYIAFSAAWHISALLTQN
jgi:hypothetical protein